MEPSTPHPPIHDLGAFLLGRLRATDAHLVEEHISVCPQCCVTLSHLSNEGDTLERRLRELGKRLRDGDIPTI